MEDFGKGKVPVGHFDAYITMKDPSKAEQIAKWARGHMKMNKELGVEHQDMSVESVDTDTGVVHLRGVAWTLSNFLNSIDGSDVDGTVSHEPPASLAETANPVRLKKSELIDIILEEVEAALTDEAASLGQKDPKYKKFPSTIFYADVDKEYKAILPVVEKLLEENPQDRPYIADALEMMMFNVRDGIHGPEMDESRLDEEEYDHDIRGRSARKHARYSNPFPQQSREQALASSMGSFFKGLEKYEETGDERWLTTLRNYLKNFRGIADVRKAITYIMNDPNRGPLGYKIDPNDAPALMKKAVKFLPDVNELDERAPDNELSPEEEVRQAMSTLRGSAILTAYRNKNIKGMTALEPQDMGVEKSAWETLMADLEGRLNEEESE